MSNDEVHLCSGKNLSVGICIEVCKFLSIQSIV
jgi:hypothetical protein